MIPLVGGYGGDSYSDNYGGGYDDGYDGGYGGGMNQNFAQDNTVRYQWSVYFQDWSFKMDVCV